MTINTETAATRMNLPEKVYSEKELTRAKNTERLIGWVQGGGVVIGGAILWNLMGWIPLVLGLVAVGWVLVKLLSRPKGEEADEAEGN